MAGGLIAYYDLSVAPPTYDATAFVCHIASLASGGCIIVLPGPNNGLRRRNPPQFDMNRHLTMRDHVLLPMLRMLPGWSVEMAAGRPMKSEPGSVGFERSLYGHGRMIKALAKGVRPLRPERDPLRNMYTRLVTITLRECEHWPKRNSNVSEWVEAAHELKRRGWQVKVIRDTLKADEPLDDLEILPRSARELEMRAMQYRAARCNLFVNGGPAWFAVALDAPALILRATTEGVPAVSRANYERYGISANGQYPNAPDYHRLVWAEDTKENILNAFERFMEST